MWRVEMTSWHVERVISAPGAGGDALHGVEHRASGAAAHRDSCPSGERRYE